MDSGVIEQGGQKQQVFRFRNESSAPMEVSTIKTMCPCANIRANASQFLRIICLSDNLMQKIHVESRVQAFAGDALLGGMSLE